METNKLSYCLWFDKDTGTTHMELVESKTEINPYGGHVPAITGTKKFIERIYCRIQKKPCLIERFLKP